MGEDSRKNFTEETCCNHALRVTISREKYADAAKISRRSLRCSMHENNIWTS